MKNNKNNKKSNFKGKDNHKKNKFNPKERDTFEKFNAGKLSYDNKSQKLSPVNEMKLSEINMDFAKQTVSVSGVIDRIVQTGGPTIFIVSDGTASLGLKGFEGPGERAYPELNEGDPIKAMIGIEEFKGELEGEIKKISKLDESEHKKFLEEILNLQKKRAEIEPVDFLVKNKILDKLKNQFVKAAQEIRLAIIQSRPIIVRHHNDTDGYCAGYALEKAILPLIIKEQTSEKAAWEFFLRAPCAAPFYEIDDSIRDVALSLRNVAKFSNKMPLVIIADNGSSPEDLLAIKHGKVHGMEFIVIDHHYSDEDVISKEVLTHINPFLVEEDGAKFSAGMLCAEFSRFINPVENIKQIPAMAGLADRIDLGDADVIEDYLKIAKEDGYSKSLLKDISTVIDFVSAKIRFMEVREYIGVLFGEPREKQKELVELLAPHIAKLKKKGLAISKANAKTQEIGNVTLQTLDIDNTFPGFGFFPKPGMCVGMVHDDLQETKNITSLVSVGIMNTALTMRATDKANFSVHELINFLNKKLPNAFVEGGGHKNAGSITFLPNKQEEVLELLKEFIKGR
jgi:archaea-specific RecJ-like exonuclease